MFEVAKLARSLMHGKASLYFDKAATVTTRPEAGVPSSLTVPPSTLINIKHNPHGAHAATLVMGGGSITLPVSFNMILELAKAAAFTSTATVISDDYVFQRNPAHNYQLPKFAAEKRE